MRPYRATQISNARARIARGCTVANPTQADEQYILRILAETTEPLYPSEITERLNYELGSGSVYTVDEVALKLKALDQKLEQNSDGRWTLKGRG